MFYPYPFYHELLHFVSDWCCIPSALAIGIVYLTLKGIECLWQIYQIACIPTPGGGVLLYHCVKPTYLPGQSLNIGGGGDLEEGVDNTWSWSGETWYQNLPWQYIALYLFSSRYMWRYTWCTSTLGLKQGG